MDEAWYTVEINVVVHSDKKIENSLVKVGQTVPIVFQSPMNYDWFDWCAIVEESVLQLRAQYREELAK